jgi:hypothetical protein
MSSINPFDELVDNFEASFKVICMFTIFLYFQISEINQNETVNFIIKSFASSCFSDLIENKTNHENAKKIHAIQMEGNKLGFLILKNNTILDRKIFD